LLLADDLADRQDRLRPSAPVRTWLARFLSLKSGKPHRSLPCCEANGGGSHQGNASSASRSEVGSHDFSRSKAVSRTEACRVAKQMVVVATKAMLHLLRGAKLARTISLAQNERMNLKRFKSPLPNGKGLFLWRYVTKLCLFCEKGD